MEAAAQPWPALGVLLLRDGLVTKDELESLLDEQVDGRQQRITSRRLGELLVERGMVTETQVAQLVAEQYELPFVELDDADIDLPTAQLLEENVARRLSAVAVGTRSDGCYVVAIADPSAVLFSDELRRSLGGQPTFVVVGQAAVDRALDRVYRGEFPSDLRGAPEDEGQAVAGVVVELPTGSRAAPVSHGAHRWPPLGALLVREGLVTEADLEAALAQQRLSSSMRLGEILVDRGTVTNADVARLVAEQYELPFVELDPTGVDSQVARLLPEKVARRRSALPIERLPDGSLRVVVADPTNAFQSDELRDTLGAPLDFCVSAPEAIEEAIEAAHRETLPEVAEVAEVTEAEARCGEADEGPHGPVLVGLDDMADVEHELDAGYGRLDEAAEEWLAETWSPPEPETLAEDHLHEVGVELPSAPDLVDDEPPEMRLAATADEALELDSPAVEPLVPSVEDAREHYDSPPEYVPEAPAGAELDEELLAEVEETVAVASAAAHDDRREGNAAEASGAHDGHAQALEDALRHALSLAATTIQLSPRPDEVVVRARVAGAMQRIATFPRAARASVARLAEQAGIDRSALGARHGLLPFAHEESTLLLWVTTLPTLLGMQVSLRVPDAEARESLSDLGLSASTESAVRMALRDASGVLLVCGPALSGRTTTLYAALREVAGAERAVAAVESRVERLLPEVDQVEVDPGSGMTYPAALRAALRSGADLVAVDELYEAETAQVAFRGARAGALVLASLEAPTTWAALSRLTAELGVEPELAASTLSYALVQQLVRRICLDCRETYYASTDELAELGRPEDESGRRLLARGRGCSTCAGTGYSGLAAVFETLPLTDDVRMLLGRGAPASAVREAAVATGMSTLHENAVGLCLDGVTTVAELGLLPRG